MPISPGKYNDLCTAVRTTAVARAALIIIIEGKRGSGFSVQTSDFEIVLGLPDILRATADSIERDSLKDMASDGVPSK